MVFGKGLPKLLKFNISQPSYSLLHAVQHDTANIYSVQKSSVERILGCMVKKFELGNAKVKVAHITLNLPFGCMHGLQ